MTTDFLNVPYPKLGVGEILICTKETKGKFEPLKHFIGKLILTIGGGGDKIFLVEEKEEGQSEVKSIQVNPHVKKNPFEDIDKNISPEISKMLINHATSGSLPNNYKFDSNEANKENEKNQEKMDELNISDNNGNNNDKNNNGNDNNKNQNKDTEVKQNDLVKKDLDESADLEPPAQIVQICKGKYHLLKLTSDGKLYCSGSSYFGVVGLGGSAYSETTKPLSKFKNIKIVQIACGIYHSLALAENGDLYSWGIGFEGQLGLQTKFNVASSPKYLSFFYDKPVKFIACGYNYSLAITNEGNLYGWGENKLGQLGLGHRQIVEHPTLIEILDKNGEQEGCVSSESLVNDRLLRVYSEKPLKICFVSAGYSHTCAITEDGFPVTFGLNIHGQLGVGNTTTSFEPRLLEKDEGGEPLEIIIKSACSTSGTFLISKYGKMYTCGSGDIGHGDLGLVKLPKVIPGQRQYSHVYCNDSTTVAFGPLRILSVSPSCGPAKGNTILSIIGTAFKEFPKLSVRFLFAGVSRDVAATFDKLSRTIFVNTPNFHEYAPTMDLPCYCTIQVTFDGKFFTEYSDKFLIYPNAIKISEVEPKCGPIEGGSEMRVKINLGKIPQKYLFSLTVGFQAKGDQGDKKSKKRGPSANKSMFSHSNEHTVSSPAGKTDGEIINPMDIENLDDQLYKANWYCCFAVYDNKTNIMTCKIPKIENFSQQQVEYNIDVAINGQQFSGFPMIYRFYDIAIDKITPDISTIEGSLQMKIYGKGLFDSPNKKAKISSVLGERTREIQWNRAEQSLLLNSVPLNWITTDESILKLDNPGELYTKYVFNVLITMNGIQWIKAGSFHYCNTVVNKIGFITFKDTDTQDQRVNQLTTQKPLSDYEKMKLGLMEPPTEKKALADYEKQVKDEEDSNANIPKGPYTGLILYGNFFPDVNCMKVKFLTNFGDVETVAFYQNERKIVCMIPLMPKIPPGEQEVMISFSVNGQQWAATDLKFLFNSPEPGMTFEEIIKMDNTGKDKKKKK